MDSNIKPAQGTILISEPFLKDFYFKRSIILLAEHNEEGTFGLVLNKPTELKLSDVMKNEKNLFPDDFDSLLYIGGPVKTDSLFFIHTRNDLIENSIKIMNGIYWGGKIDTVNRLIQNGELKADEIRFYIGYSGWAPKQLEEELRIHSWVVSKASAAFLLKNTSENLWTNAVKKLGKEYLEWVNYPIDPQLN
ncbi:MAG: YqgE/AlgH family protein [Bacteroidales bacterium]|jgi:putative transcriptional regulator|nr:YqgE/AlgH family protein [Bacteroidales bacterium]MDD4213670.1 YqgE/AlgH family protein [Bacteroidales bacterium]